MQMKNSLLLRLSIVAILLGILFFMPFRELVKLTAIFGIPFIFGLGFMLKKPRYSFKWFITIFLLLAIVGGYGYMLTTLPDRIEVKTILKAAVALEAQGNYADAIEEYKQLGQYGKQKKMEERIASAQIELEGQIIIAAAQQYIEQGNLSAAQELLATVPPHTRSAKEAKKLLKSLE